MTATHLAGKAPLTHSDDSDAATATVSSSSNFQHKEQQHQQTDPIGTAPGKGEAALPNEQPQRPVTAELLLHSISENIAGVTEAVTACANRINAGRRQLEAVEAQMQDLSNRSYSLIFQPNPPRGALEEKAERDRAWGLLRAEGSRLGAEKKAIMASISEDVKKLRGYCRLTNVVREVVSHLIF